MSSADITNVENDKIKHQLFEAFCLSLETYRRILNIGEVAFPQKPIVKDYYNKAKVVGAFNGTGEKFSQELKQYYFDKYKEELVLRKPDSFVFDENIVRDLTLFIDTYFEQNVQHFISTIPNDYRLENYPESVKQFIGCFVNEKTNKLDYSDKVNNKRIRSKCTSLLKAKCKTAYSSPVKMIGLSGQCENCGHNLYGGQCMICRYRNPQQQEVARVNVVRPSLPITDALESLRQFQENDNEEDETEEVEN